VADTARAQVRLGDDDRADGRIWHTPAAPTLTPREFIALAAEVAGSTRRPIALPQVTSRLIALFERRLRGYSEVDHQRSRPWVVDHSAFDAAFGPFPVTPHAEAIAATLDWYRAS
jgi:nucleoside-diphosphate-sugar epimerase